MGGGSKQTQTTKTEPWAPQQQYLQQVFGEAADIYGRGQAQLFPGPMVAGFSPAEQAAQQQLIQRGSQPDPLRGLAEQQYAQTLTGQPLQSIPGADIITRGAYGGFVNPALLPAAQYATGTGFVPEQLRSLAADPMAGIGTGRELVEQTATGQMLQVNPFLDDIVNRALGQVTERYQTATAPGVDAAFMQHGRFGGGAHTRARQASQEALQRELGATAASMYQPAYESERARQQQAQQMLMAAQAGDPARQAQLLQQLQQSQMGGIQQLGTLGEQDIGRQLAAAQAMQQPYEAERARQVQMLSQLPMLQQSALTDITGMASAGEQQRQMQQALIDEQMLRHGFQYEAPWQHLAQFAPFIQGQFGGTQAATGPGTNRAGSALGGGLAGAATGAQIGSLVPGIGTALGAGIGAGVGLLGGAL